MKKRSLSQHLFSLFVTGGKLQHLTDLVKNDPYLDMEFRGDCVMIYYRGGRLLTIYDVDKYDFGYYTWGKQKLVVDDVEFIQ